MKTQLQKRRYTKMKSLWDSVLWLRRKNKQDKEEILTAVNAVQNLFKTSGEATASASDIVAPKTAYNGTTLITGTIADKTGTSEYAATASIDNTNKKIKMQVPADGKYGTKNYLYQSFSNIASLIGLTASKLVKNNTVLGITGNSSNMDTSGCDAVAAQILSGKKAGVKGNVVTGTMVNRAGTTVRAAAVTQDDDNTYFAVPEAAYYDKNSKIATANSNLGNINLAKFIGVSVYVGSGGDGLYKYTYDVEKCGKIKLEKSSFPDCALAWAHGKNDNSLTSVTFYKADGTTKISDLAMTVDETYSVPSEAKYAVLASSRWSGSSARNSYTYIQSV